MKNRLFKRIVTIYFHIGVNIIGLPLVHSHRLALYSVGRHTTPREPKWFGMNKSKKR